MNVERHAWRTSSFSTNGSGSSGNCVEVAPLPTGVAVRDTKDRTRTPHTDTRPAWHAFVMAIQAGEFDR